MTEARHTRYYLREAEKWAERTSGSRALELLRLLRLELDNLTAIIRRSELKEPELAARAALAVEPMLATRGPLDMAIALLDTAVDAAERAGRKELLVRALLAREHARTEAGRSRDREAQINLERALAIARAMASPELEGLALMALATFQLEAHCKVEESRITYKQAIAAFRAAKNRLLEGRAAIRVGYTLIEAGRLDEARAVLTEALSLTRQLDDRRFEGYALTTISLVDHLSGQLGSALLQLERGVAIHRSVGNRRNEGMDLAYAGLLHYELGSFEAASGVLADAVEICRDVGLRKFEAFAQAIFGALFADDGALDRSEAAFVEAYERMEAVNDLEHLSAIRLLEEDRRLREAKERIDAAHQLPKEAFGSDVRICLRILGTRVRSFELERS